MQKKVVSLKPLPFIYGLFPKGQSSQHVGNDVRLRFKGLGMVIQYVVKERALHIASEYDHQILFPLLICAHKYLNPSDVSVRAPSFASQSIEPTSFYDFIKTNEEVTLSILKEQLNHFRIKIVTDEECKDPIAWWRTHEVQFSYVWFVARQLSGIVDSQN
jgi:hypothetical protein